MNILIYTPSLGGHRQVATAVIANIYLGLGHKVYLLVPFQLKEELNKWPHLNQFIPNHNVIFISSTHLSTSRKNGLSAEDICSFQRKYKIDFTLFEEGDIFIDQFIRLGNSKSITLYGKSAAIFTHTLSWFPGESPSTGLILQHNSIINRAKKLKAHLTNNKDFFIKREMTPPVFFPKYIIEKKVLSTALMADERILEKYASPFVWMPSIYRSFSLGESGSDIAELKKVKPIYDEFLELNNQKEIILYFGTSSLYKGYTKLLNLAVSDPDSCFIHCGLISNDCLANKDITNSRLALRKSGRLFETNSFINSQELVEYFFNSANFLVSTHNFLGPSGTMIQAIELGKPILTPDKGLIGYRTHKNKLGLTYTHNDVSSLKSKWTEMKQIKGESYAENLAVYYNKFSRESLVDLYTSILDLR